MKVRNKTLLINKTFFQVSSLGFDMVKCVSLRSAVFMAKVGVLLLIDLVAIPFYETVNKYLEILPKCYSLG